MALIERAIDHVLQMSGVPCNWRYEPLRLTMAQELLQMDAFFTLITYRVDHVLSATPVSKATLRQVRRELREKGFAL